MYKIGGQTVSQIKIAGTENPTLSGSGINTHNSNFHDVKICKAVVF